MINRTGWATIATIYFKHKTAQTLYHLIVAKTNKKKINLIFRHTNEKKKK